MALTPAVAVAGSLVSGVGGLGGLLDGRLDPLLGGNGEASAGDDLPDFDAGEVPPGIQPGPEDYVLPPGTRIDITQSEYQQYQDCMDSLVSADVDVCWSIVT